MRKFLVFIMFLTLQYSARGQNGYELLYWFDCETECKSTTATNTGRYVLDVSHLPVGMHTLHMQITDTASVSSSPVSKDFFKLAQDGMELKLTYWFDERHKAGKTRTLTGRRFKEQIDVSDIDVGFHTLSMQASYNGISSSTKSKTFYKTLFDAIEERYICWFDEDASTQQRGSLGNGIIWLDVTKLSDGFHTLYIQAEKQMPTQALAHNFIKVPQTDGIDSLSCIIFVDNEIFYKDKVKSNGGIINFDLDVTSLSQGVHILQVYAVTPSGAATALSNSFFIRSTTDSEMSNMKCIYTIDGNTQNKEMGIYNNGAYHFDIDVASLNDGIHQISYFLVDDNGVSTESRTSFFIKTPVGGNGFVQYDYWINENEKERKSTKLNEKVDPLKLITLLPVESAPIRSSQFHFEVKEGTPTVYAKNTLNMRFFDSTTRFVDLSREYIDYNVEQKIEEIEELKPLQTFARPGENSIKWFKFEAHEGDTIAFKSNQATSLQVFSPTGEEIYKASGNESTKMDGCHTWEDGTHYLAVHDVTGSKADVSLDFLHMEKYDVISQDVKIVGDAGASTITYKGNGLKALCEVRFINAQNDTIIAEYIERTSDAEVGVIADFNTAAHGEYDAIFIFSGYEYKTIINSVRVEEATDINLDTKVSFASTYLRGNSNTYNVSITNSGNMTAYRTPVHIYVSSKNINSISRIDIRGLDLPGIFDGVEKDSIPESEREWLKDLEEKIADNHYFIDAKVFDETTRDSVYAKAGYFFTDIAPNSSKKISIAVDADETFELWITIPEENAPLSNKPSTYARKAASRSLKDSYCCIRERVECVATLVADGIGIANSIVGLTGAPQAAALGVADCVASSVNTIISSAGTIMCGEGDVEKNFWDKVKSVVNGTSITGMVTSCASKVLPWKNFNKLLEAIGDVSGNASMVFGLGIDQAECIIAFTQKKPNCPRKPGGGGGASSPVTSFDPNDIVGFTAESGSRYVPSDFEHTHYTIRCENDPAFATAAAHTVVVTDTLDSRKLDLTTFAARSVKIGNKVMELNGEKSFVKTLDLRTEIDVIAEVSLDFNEETGVAVWSIKSLSPTTMEPTDDPMQGVLPVNNGGNGEAEFHFDIKLKPTLADGDSVNNTASIIFDNNDPIVTPVWTNIIDNSAPVSSITGIEEISDSTIIVNWEGEDTGSGIYRYQLYAQPGIDAEWMPLLGDTLKTSSKLLYKRNIDFGFCIVATDSAGNVEAKELTREVEFKRIHIAGDADRSGEVNVLDINATLDYIMNGEANEYDIQQMDSNEDGEVNLLDINATLDIILERRRGVATLPYREKHKAAKTLKTPVL